MNWVPLRKNNIPLVDMQVSKAIVIYQKLYEKVQNGDTSFSQKLSQFELSVHVKKRINQMDHFYSQHFQDQRVRIMQSARMKLAGLFYQEQTGQNFHRSSKRERKESYSNNNNNKSGTPGRQKQRKMVTQVQEKGTGGSRNQKSKSPLPANKNKSPNTNRQLQIEQNSSKKRLTLQIPSQTNRDYFFSRQPSGKQLNQIPKLAQQAKKQTKSSRKMQQIGVNKDKSSKQLKNYDYDQQKPSMNTKPRQSKVQQKEKHTSRLNQTLNQSQNTSSMKKLNDLIFTIKMTKQEYQDFMDIKKRLNNSKR